MKSLEPDKKPGIIATSIGIVTLVLFAFGAVTAEAIATMIAWGWFVTPVLGLDKLAFQEAVGLVALVNFVLLPIAVPLNAMNQTITRYTKQRAVSDLMNVLRGWTELEERGKNIK